MVKILYLVILMLLNNSLLAFNNSFTVSGSVTNQTESLMVLFKEYNTVQNIQNVLDTIYTNDAGKFQTDFNYGPGIYQVDFAGEAKVNIAIEEKQHVNIILNLPKNKDDVPAIKVDGSKDAVLVYSYDTLQKAAYKKWLNPVRRNIRLAKEAGKVELIPDLTEQEQANLMAYQNELADFAKKNFGNSIALFYAAIRLNPSLHLDFMEHIAMTFNKLRPELALTKLYNSKIERYKKTAIGSIAPDIQFKTNDGKDVRISDQKGKYLLFDFWASWCNPCRFENINYAKLYKKYRDKGFEIFAISIDTNEKLWQRASKRDKIKWINVSDFKGWGTEAALTYNVFAIPANFLLDKNGKIIAKNLRGEELKKKLSELFE